MSDDYIKGDTLLPWAPFHSPLTDHDKQAIAELNATGAAQAAAKKAESLAKLADHKKIEKARKTWGRIVKQEAKKALTEGKRWNSIKAKWE